jgi:hypothetical protein
MRATIGFAIFCIVGCAARTSPADAPYRTAVIDGALPGRHPIWVFPSSRGFVVDLLGDDATDVCLDLLAKGAPNCRLSVGSGIDIFVRGPAASPSYSVWFNPHGYALNIKKFRWATKLGVVEVTANPTIETEQEQR